MKLRQLDNVDIVAIEKIETDTFNHSYKIYTRDAMWMWFVMMIPVINSIIALFYWISSLTKNNTIEIKEPEEKKKKILKIYQ